MRVFLVGPPGSGKSTVGRHLATQLKASFYDLDEIIEERAGANIPWIFDVEGESGFRDREQAVVQDFAGRDNVVVATGGGVVMREANREVLKKSATVVYLSASLKTLVNRTRGNDKRPLLAGEDPRPVLEQLLEIREPLYRDVAHVTVVSGGSSARKLAGVIVEKLAAHQDK